MGLPDDPAVQAWRFFMGPNVLPDKKLLTTEKFKEIVSQYFMVVHELALEILHLIAHTLPYGLGVFSEFFSRNVVAPLRILRYPPARPPSATGCSLLPAEVVLCL